MGSVVETSTAAGPSARVRQPAFGEYVDYPELGRDEQAELEDCAADRSCSADALSRACLRWPCWRQPGWSGSPTCFIVFSAELGLLAAPDAENSEGDDCRQSLGSRSMTGSPQEQISGLGAAAQSSPTDRSSKLVATRTIDPARSSFACGRPQGGPDTRHFEGGTWQHPCAGGGLRGLASQREHIGRVRDGLV